MVGFTQFKKDVLFQEGRLKGLFDACLGSEISMWLEEKTRDRESARLESEEVLHNCEENATMPRGGKWTTTRVPSYLRLELEPRFLVGSTHYELPEKADHELLRSLIFRIQELMQIVPAGEPVGLMTADKIFEELQSIEWSKQDLKTLVGALDRKSSLLEELANLSGEMQQKQWHISRLEVKKEELKRKEDWALAEGEIAVGNDMLEDRLGLQEDLMKMCMEKLKSLDDGMKKCTEEKKNKLNEWKVGAGSLAVLKDQKLNKKTACSEDLGKLKRGLEYEANESEKERELHMEEVRKNEDKLAKLNQNVLETTDTMENLAKSFNEAEDKLKQLAVERHHLFVERLDLITKDAQRVSDFEEFCDFSAQHQACLEETDTLCTKAVEALASLQIYTTGSADFLEQSFNHTKLLLEEISVSNHEQLRAMHAEYFKDASVLLRRKEHTLKQIEEEIEALEIRAEQCREVLDPQAKKYVIQQREKVEEYMTMTKEIEHIQDKLAYADDTYFGKVERKWKEKGRELEHPRDSVEDTILAQKEHLLDNRDRVLEDDADRVLDERDNIDQFVIMSAEQAALRPIQRETQRLAASTPGAPANENAVARSPLPVVSNSTGFPHSGAASSRLGQKRETRTVACYSAAPSQKELKSLSGTFLNNSTEGSDSDALLWSVKPKEGPKKEIMPSITTGRASPLEIARTRRQAPRTIGNP